MDRPGRRARRHVRRQEPALPVDRFAVVALAVLAVVAGVVGWTGQGSGQRASAVTARLTASGAPTHVAPVVTGGPDVDTPDPAADDGAAASGTDPAAPAGTSSTTPAGPWHVVGIGDSVTSGHGCDCDFVADYARLTSQATGKVVTPDNLGVDGWTSADLLGALSGDTAQASAVRTADIVLVTIGANDFYDGLGTWQGSGCTGDQCFTSDVATVRENVRRIVEAVRALRHGAPTQILVTDYWNVFEDGSRAVRDHGQAYLDIARTATTAANAAIVDGARSAGATTVDLLRPFEQADGGVDALLQDDGDHPDGDGHALIARTLAAAGWTAFRT